MWTRGTIGEYKYWIKHYEEGSEYGINGGRISKIEIRRNGKTIVNYDRGWDIRPTDKEDKAFYNGLLKMYN